MAVKRTTKIPRYTVVDTETGRTGYLVERPGFVAGGTYINPTWAIQFDDIKPEEPGDEE